MRVQEVTELTSNPILKVTLSSCSLVLETSNENSLSEFSSRPAVPSSADVSQTSFLACSCEMRQIT